MKKIALIILASALFTGCASVQMESDTVANRTKRFAQPSPGNAGLYVYRDSAMGKSLKKEVRVDGKCLGTTGPDVFLYTEVPGNTEHEISTDSEFSPNKLKLMFEAGKNYFVRQYIKMGILVGGADLEAVPEAQGKQAVKQLGMATPGRCASK